MRRRLPYLLLALCFLARPALADDDAKTLVEKGDVRVETFLEAEKTLYVGQKVRLVWKLMTSSFFKAAPKLPDLDLRHTIVRPEGSTAINGTESVDGKTFATQRWERALYPQRPGTYEIPAQSFTVFVADDDGQVIEVPLRSKPLTFVATMPEGAPRDVLLLTTTGLTLEVTYDRELKDLKVGDAIERTITRTITDAPGMLLPPIPPVTLEGIAAYPREPTVEDRSQRGTLTGTRVETTSYVLQQPGTFTFPELSIPWWSLENDALETLTAEARTFEVAPNPDAVLGEVEGTDAEAVGAATQAEDRQWLGWLIAALVLAATIWMVQRLRPAIRKRMEADRLYRLHSPEAALQALDTACRNHDAGAAYRALQQYLDRVAGDGPALTPLIWARSVTNPKLREGILDLDRRLFGTEQAQPAWRGEGFAERVRHEARQRAAAGDSAPPSDWHILNPRPATSRSNASRQETS